MELLKYCQQATFEITLDAPSDLTALSNMPVIDEKCSGNMKTIYFEESPVMSIYLVALVVGLFDHIDNTTSLGLYMSYKLVFLLGIKSLLSRFLNSACRCKGWCILPCWQE